MKKSLSIICVLFFILLAMSSSKNMGVGFFYKNDMVEDASDTRNYLEKNNGDKVYGDKILLRSKMLKKDKIAIDGQEYNLPDIIGFRESNVYHGRYGGGYFQRVVHGKINIYYAGITNHSGQMASQSSQSVFYYSQVGNLNNLVPITNKNDFLNLLNGCQASIDMLNKKNRHLSRAVKEDQRYFNKMFEIYNNDCKK